MMEKEYHFIEEIREQPAAIKKSLETTDPVIKNLARRYTDKIERIVLVGCGDPHMLSLGAVYAFERWAYIPYQADHLRAGGFIRPGFASGRNKGQHTRKRYFGIKKRVI